MPLTWDRESLEDMEDLLPEIENDFDPGDDNDDDFFDDHDWDDEEDWDDDFSDTFGDDDEEISYVGFTIIIHLSEDE